MMRIGKVVFGGSNVNTNPEHKNWKFQVSIGQCTLILNVKHKSSPFQIDKSVFLQICALGLVSAYAVVTLPGKPETSADEAMNSSKLSVDSPPIDSLSDELLSQVFTYVRVQERIRLSEVCKRWAGVSRSNWTDIVSLDLSTIPSERIAPILRLCPKLASITARDCELNLQSSIKFLPSELKSLRLYDVELDYDCQSHNVPERPDTLFKAFLDTLQCLPHLKDLVLLGVGHCCFAIYHIKAYVPFTYLPVRLERLQITGGVFAGRCNAVLRENRLGNGLRCLILDDSRRPTAGLILERSVNLLMELRQLRELCLGSLFGRHIEQHVGQRMVDNLARLEILCLGIEYASANVANLTPLFNAHPTLRILIITGEIGADAVEILIPPRRRYPHGYGSDPLPLLHVFIGGQIAQKIRFTRSPDDAMDIRPINLPMPAFLEQPEVAALFKGSWIAEVIREGAKSNARLWNYDRRMADSFLVL